MDSWISFSYDMFIEGVSENVNNIVIDNQIHNDQHYTVFNMALGHVCEGTRCFEGIL
jgi:hypothetical protein